MASRVKKITATEFTRPANATAFAAGDVVGPASGTAVITLASPAQYNYGAGKITQIRLHSDSSTGTATNGTFRVHFFSTAPTSVADNSPWVTLYTEKAYFVGYRDMDVFTGGATGLTSEMTATQLPLPFKCTGSNNLYAIVTATGAYTPVSGEKFTLSITVEQEDV